VADDIVTRLRSENRMVLAPLHMSEAADEIERLRAVLDAIDAIHQSFIDPETGMTFCDECNTIDLWPCATHTLLHPKEARRG